MKNRWLAVAGVLLIVAIILYTNNHNNKRVLDQIDKLTKEIELRNVFEDSLWKRLKEIEIIDTGSINNFYDIKYEKESAVIRNNNVNADVGYFSAWYNIDQ
jgi:hypothetical protein